MSEHGEPIPTAREWMRSDPLTFSPQTEVLQVIAELSKRGLMAAPVVDDDHRLLGMLTEKDCLRLLSVASFHTPRSGHAGELMSAIAHPVGPDMDVFQVVELFLQTNFPVLPVVEDGKVVGVISRQQMLTGFLKLIERVEVSRRPGADTSRDLVQRPRSIESMQSFFSRFDRDQLVRLLGRR